MTVVFMFLLLYAPDVLADLTRNDKEEIFVVDMEDVYCVNCKLSYHTHALPSKTSGRYKENVRLFR